MFVVFIFWRYEFGNVFFSTLNIPYWTFTFSSAVLSMLLSKGQQSQGSNKHRCNMHVTPSIWTCPSAIVVRSCTWFQTSILRERTIRKDGAITKKGAKINREADAGEEQYKSGIIICIERVSLTLWDSSENLMPLLFMPEELCSFQNTIIKLDRTLEKLK